MITAPSTTAALLRNDEQGRYKDAIDLARDYFGGLESVHKGNRASRSLAKALAKKVKRTLAIGTGDWASAVSLFQSSGSAHETMPGRKLMALQMEFSCLQNLGRTNDVIRIAEEITRTPGPEELKSVIVPRAELTKYQLLTDSNLSNNEKARSGVKIRKEGSAPDRGKVTGLAK